MLNCRELELPVRYGSLGQERWDPLYEFAQQRFGVFQVFGTKPCSEPCVDFKQQLVCFGLLVLLLPPAGKAHSSPEFPGLGFLLVGNLNSLSPVCDTSSWPVLKDSGGH